MQSTKRWTQESKLSEHATEMTDQSVCQSLTYTLTSHIFFECNTQISTRSMCTTLESFQGAPLEDVIAVLEHLEETFKFQLENGEALFSDHLEHGTLFERINHCILVTLSELVGVHFSDEEDELCSAQRVKIKRCYLRICDLLRDQRIKDVSKESIHEMQCAALELFNNAQIQRLQRIETLQSIENVIKNTDRTLESAHWNNEDRTYFTNSVLDLFQIIDPIITELLSLPLYRYQIVYVEQLFASLIAHFVIKLDPKSFVTDSEFVLFIGDLYKLRERATAYLEHHDFRALMEMALHSKRDTVSLQQQLRSLGINESVHSELRCDTVFVFMNGIVNELVVKRGQMEWDRVRVAVQQLLGDIDHHHDCELIEDLQNKLFDAMYSELEEIEGHTPSAIGHAVFLEMNKAIIDGIAHIVKERGIESNGDDLQFGVLVSANHLIRRISNESTLHGFESNVVKDTAEYKRCIQNIADQFQIVAEKNAKDLQDTKAESRKTSLHSL